MPRARSRLGSRVVFGVEPADSPSARACLRRYFDELTRRFPGGFEDGGCGSADAADFLPPKGAFVVGREAGQAVACGGIRCLAPGVGEIKRMWVDPLTRGRGVGRELLHSLETQGAALGMVVLRLDTNLHLHEAVRLYEGSGYRRIPAYNKNRHSSMWLEKRLSTAALLGEGQQ